MATIEKGARVTFFRAADRQTRLAGTVEEVKGDEVLVRTDPTEVLIWAAASDVVLEPVLEPEPAAAPEAPADSEQSSNSPSKKRR